MALSSTAIPHSTFRLAYASCYPVQMKLLKGQSRKLQSHLLIHVGRHPNYSTSSVKLPTKALFCEPSKVKLHINFIREKMWDITPNPIKEFPWKKAKDVALKRALETGQQALKWSLVALLIFGTISDIIFSISKNKELFVPFGLFGGCIMATFLKETSQELFPNLEETGMAWNLMGLSCFFVVVKILATYFTLGRQIFLLHAANGGLMQILWLSRTSQEDNERGRKQPLVDDVSTTMGVEKLCKQLDGRHRKDVQGTTEGGYKMDSTAADALDGIGKVVQPPTDDVSTALGVVDSTTAEALDGAGKDVQGTPEGYTMESTAAKALDGAEKVNDITSDQKVANDDKILTGSINSRAETMKDPLADTVDGYTMDLMAAEALDGAEKVNDIAFDQRVANENKILIESTCRRAERMEDPLTDTVDGFTMDSTAAEDLDGAEEVNDTTFDQKVANDDKILLIGGITDSRAAERMNDPLADTVEKRCLINSGYAINPMAAEALDAAEKVNDTTKSMNNRLIADSVDGYTVDSTTSEALDGAVKDVQPLADEVSTAMGVEKLCKQQDRKHEKAVQGTPEGEYPMDFTDAEALDGAQPLADYVSTATGVEKLCMQSDGEQEKDVQRTPEGSMYTMDSMATEALDGAEKVNDIIFDQSVANDNKILIKSNNSSAERMKDPLTHTADGYRMVSTAAEARVEGCTIRKENLDLAKGEALESSPKLEKEYVMDSTAAEALDGAGKVSDTTFDQNVANDNKILVGSTADSGAERMNDLLADTVEVLCTDAENALDWAMDSVDAEAFGGEGKVNDNSFDQNVENDNKFFVRSTDGRAERMNDPVADTVEQVDGLSITRRKKKKNVRAGVDIHGNKALDPPDHPLEYHPELPKEELSSLTVSQRKRPRKARVEREGTVGKGNLDVTTKALESSQLELKKEPVGGLSIAQRRKKEVRARECTHGEKKVLNPPDHELHPELPKDGYAMDSMTAEALDGAGKVNGPTKSMNDPLADSVEQVGDLPITQRKKKKQIRSAQGTHREKAAVDPPDHALDSHPELSNE